MHISSLLILFPFLSDLAFAIGSFTEGIQNLTGIEVLEPVSDDGWDNSISKRSTNHPTDLLNNTHMVWHSPSNSSKNIFANMTVNAGPTEYILNMDRFRSMLKRVECSQQMILTFDSATDYQYAVGSWQWVNVIEENTIILIATDLPGCGATKLRKPYVINSVEFDSESLAIHLNATQKEWKKAIGTYALDFGQYSGPVSSIVRRQSFEKRDYDKQVNINLNHQLPATFTTSADLTNALSVGIACSNCGIQGTLTFSGHIETHFFIPKVFTISAKPTGIQMALNLAVSLSAIDPSLKVTFPVNAPPIPLDGFGIPDILTFGPELTLGAGITITGVKGKATISSSVIGKIPDSSTADMTIWGGTKGATFSGWVPQWSTGPLDVSASIQSIVEVFGSAKVGVAIDILGTGAEVNLQLKIPDVSLTASLTHDDSGVCTDKKHVDGVSLALGIGADLSLVGQTDVATKAIPIFTVPIFHESVSFGPSICFGFGPDVESLSSSSISTIIATTLNTLQTSTSSYTTSHESIQESSATSTVSSTLTSSFVSSTKTSLDSIAPSSTTTNSSSAGSTSTTSSTSQTKLSSTSISSASSGTLNSQITSTRSGDTKVSSTTSSTTTASIPTTSSKDSIASISTSLFPLSSSALFSSTSTLSFSNSTSSLASSTLSSSTSSSSVNTTTSSAPVHALPIPTNPCNHDNCLREFIRTPAVSEFCKTYTATINTATTGLPTFIANCQNDPYRISSACTCIGGTLSTSSPEPSYATMTSSSMATSTSTNQGYY